MDGAGARPGLRIDAALAAAVDHVRLSYDYLDTGDLDGYASLFESGMPPAVSGARVVVPERLLRSGVEFNHAVLEVFGSDRRLAAVCRLTVGDEVHDFVDVFHISDSALFIDLQRFVSSEDDGQPPCAAGTGAVQ